MCGITGIVVKEKISPRHREAVAKMSNCLIHRGPDGQGEFNGEAVSFAMRRLSIIDLEGGWQPLFSENKNLVLIANGEIYNYIELTNMLQAKGHRFASHSDCESILHLYEEYGEQCVHHLRGMFAFALYDKKKSKMMIARDRMGEKPLYYYQKEGLFLFASEMKSLMSSGMVPFVLDPIAVNNYFHYQYVPEPATPLQDVNKLPAGHLITIDLNSWKIHQKCYWRMEDALPVEGDPISLIRDELDTISKLIIRSDVPVGVALSGGLDSSAIAALAVRKYPGIMHAFSVGYPGRPANDERNDAKALADYLKMPFHEIELKTSDLAEIFEELNSDRDDPIADISGFGYYAVSREAKRNGVPVLLQGQGGDELFWGYPWVRDAAVKTDASLRKPSLAKRRLDQVKQILNVRPRTIRSYVQWARALKNAVTESERDVRIAPNSYRPIFHELAPDFQIALTSMEQYYTAHFKENLGASSAYDLFTYPDLWNHTDIRITRLICETYLLENGIAQGDRLSMANSVELRLPFVDYKLVELVIGLRKTYQADPDYKYFPKPWLRGAMKGILPEWVMTRPKQGFAPPVREWHAEIFNKIGHHLKDGYLVRAGVLTNVAGKVLSTGLYPPGAIAPISFKALVLELWCRKMIALQHESIH